MNALTLLGFIAKAEPNDATASASFQAVRLLLGIPTLATGEKAAPLEIERPSVCPKCGSKLVSRLRRPPRNPPSQTVDAFDEHETPVIDFGDSAPVDSRIIGWRCAQCGAQSAPVYLPYDAASLHGDQRNVAAKMLAGILTEKLRGRTSLTIWKGKPAILCDSLTTAAFAATAFRSVRTCAVCQNLFDIDPNFTDRPFCSKHGAAWHQRNYRERQKRLRSRKPRKERK